MRVQWSRQDEHGWSPKGPAQVDEVKAAVDGNGKLTVWDFTDYSFPRTEADGTPMLASVQVGLRPVNPDAGNGSQSAGEIYGVDNQRIVANLINWRFAEPHPTHQPTARARRPVALLCHGMPARQIADLQDPVEFRLRHLSADKRAGECLQAAAAKAQWQKRPVGVAHERQYRSRPRYRVDTPIGRLCHGCRRCRSEQASGQVVVQRIVCAHDCGLIVNPDGIKNQIEGNIVQA